MTKHLSLVAFSLALILLIIAAQYYPGGSQSDPNSIGYRWTENYLCNLFGSKAVNGADNPSMLWAVSGAFCLCVGFAVFFYTFAQKLPTGSAANIIKYIGTGAMVFAFFIVTPYHDSMVTISGTGGLIAMFYITALTFKSKLLYMKLLSTLCLLLMYVCNFMYYTQTGLAYLPVMQKVALATVVIWMLCLTYGTNQDDFKPKSV